MMGGTWGMGGLGSWGTFGLIGGILGLLFQLGLVTLVVVGIVWAVRSLGQLNRPAVTPGLAAVSSNPCSNCGAALQQGWKVCPYCGESAS